jgi:phage shock protein B
VRIDPILIPILAIVCVFVIAPWMAFRHEEKKREWQARETMTAEDAARFHGSLERLERRLKSLEAILDDEAPGWRKRHGLGED